MFISTIHSLENIENLVKSGADAIVIGIPHFSIRHCNEVQLDELPIWKQRCNELGIKLYINFLRLCMEEDMPKVAKLLSFFKDLDIDGVYYADEGVLFEAMQLEMTSKMIYQPETLVTSSNDVSFYLGQGLQSVSLAHELSLDEILSIASKCHNVEVLIHGYFSIMYSRRALITNYLNAIKSNVDGMNKRFDLIEQTRDERMPIIQDDSGTHVFSAEPISSFDQLESLEEKGISRFRIDTLFMSDEVGCEILSAYKNHQKLDQGSNRWYHETTIKKKEGQ